MTRVAVVGGTRFFGRQIVRRLLDDGVDVTVITRGRTPDTFGSAVTRLTAEASSTESLTAAVKGHVFDSVLHQVVYTPREADAAVAAFEDRTQRLVMTSTIEVYNPNSFDGPAPGFSTLIREDELDMREVEVDRTRPWHELSFIESHYGEGKRQAEAILLSHAPFAVATVRLAHVLAHADDFTGRLAMLVESVREGRPVVLHPDPGPTTFVRADQAAHFLECVLHDSVSRPLNAGSGDPVDSLQLLHTIGQVVGREPVVVRIEDASNDPNASPFTYPQPFAMDTSAARALHPVFGAASAWLPKLVDQFVRSTPGGTDV